MVSIGESPVSQYRLCVLELGSENFINVNQSGLTAAPRTIRGLAVDLLWPLNTCITIQTLCEVHDRLHF